jgi:L-alanine-DL-glutamate epimerase-like enolase superfamily enzyme
MSINPNIARIDIFKMNIPLLEPFVISLETITHAENLLVCLTAESGHRGYGECSPYRRIAGETQDSGYAVAPLLAHAVLGRDALHVQGSLRAMDQAIAGNRCIKSALDLALYDLAARCLEVPLYRYLGGKNDKMLRTDMTVSMLSPDAMAAAAIRFQEAGFDAIKLKLGGGLPLDVERVRAVRQAVGPDIALRVDANQAWDPATAVQVLRQIAPFGIQYCEQPIAASLWTQLPELRRQSPIPIMADEALFDHFDALRLAQLGACDLFNIKLSKAGGLSNAIKIAHIAEAAGLVCQVGCFSESRIGMSALAHFALATEQVRYYDLDAPLMLSQDPAVGGIQYHPGGWVSVPDETPGIGAVPEEGFLSALEHVTLTA